MKNISFMLTPSQFLDGSKTVTRRLGWETLKVGDHLMGCEKCQGRRNGEPLVRLGELVVITVRREPLRRMLDDPNYGLVECKREGFPTMTPAEFVALFCKSHADCTPETIITRIEFRKVENVPGAVAGSPPSFTGYQPELWTMRKDDIYAARMALTDGIAYTRELLANHDRDLGRNHRSNKIAAEHMEKAITAMQCALIGLRPAPAEDLENDQGQTIPGQTSHE